MMNDILVYISLFLAVIVLVAVSRWLYKRSQYESERRGYPPDTVILHQLGRGPTAPSVSPFPIKLETYLRIAKIPYQNDLSGRFSSKGKTPWMTYNNLDVADSQLCIDYLNKKLDINLNDHLSPAQAATARAFQKMLEENTYWCLVRERWVENKEISAFILKSIGVPSFTIFFAVWNVKKSLYAQGMGRHSVDEMFDIVYGDLNALSTFLGNKKYLMGDKICETDCAIFGMMSQFVWLSPGSRIEQWLNNEFSNLRDYCFRIRDEFWPDWSDCCTSPS